MLKHRRLLIGILIAFGLLLSEASLGLPVLSAAEIVWRLGFLSVTTADSFHDSFFTGLKEFGYVEGQNLRVEWRLAAVNEKRLADAAAQLAKLRPDVIVARGTQATFAAKRATSTTPIVMTGSSDPVGTGLVASLAQPGANVTGMSVLAPDLAQKRLELVSRVVGPSRIAILWNPTNAGNLNELEQSKLAANVLKLRLLFREVRQPKDLHRAFKSLIPKRINALVTLSDALLSSARTDIVHFTRNHRLPGMFHLRDFVEEGGLMSYGPDLHDSFKRAAYYVNRIFNGRKPAELPVEQPMKFELVINLRTAKQTGVNVPNDVLALANRVIQ